MDRLEFGWVLDDGSYICDGCNVRDGHMHRCHGDDGAWMDGRSCECRECVPLVSDLSRVFDDAKSAPVGPLTKGDS